MAKLCIIKCQLRANEKSRCVVTTGLLSKASGQLQMIKKKKHFSFTLLCQLSSSKLVAKAQNETLYLLRRSYFCSYLYVCLCVCVVPQFDLSITKQNYLSVRCQSLSHIPNTLCDVHKSAIVEAELDYGGKHDKTTDGRN